MKRTARTRRDAPRRLGILGGTFDPPHVGHLALAEWAREELLLDEVIFVPAGTPPHKRALARSSAANRLAMTRAAVRGNPAFRVSALETSRSGSSWTVDTIRSIAAKHPGAELWLLMGADMFATFDTWREAAGIAALARLAVAARPGAKAPKTSKAAGRGRVRWLGNPGIEVSSSAVRERARAGRSVRYLVPEGVARYLRTHALYGSGS